MSLDVPIVFRNKASVCTIYIDNSTSPCYVFVDLQGQELITEFGKEVTIKTDFIMRLPKQDDYPELTLLRETIFNAIKYLPEFLATRRSASSIAM